ncbi:MAG: hypothetical protein AAGE52_30145 [Myxococcota bacterium]
MAVLLALPQAVFPREGPSLWLDATEVAAVVAEEDALPAPSGEQVERLRELFAEQGRAETIESEPRVVFRTRTEALRNTTLALREEAGDDAVVALRAAAVTRAFEALRGGLSAEDEEAALGTFPRMLERYDAMRDGRIVAPSFVVRTLYKARWNGIHQLPLTDGFHPVELQAYHGWLALHATAASAERRRSALDAYQRAGGRNVVEARAYLAALAGHAAEASLGYGRIWENHGNLRARNHALAIQGANP